MFRQLVNFQLIVNNTLLTCYKAVEKLSGVLKGCLKAHLLGYFILVSTSKLLQSNANTSCWQVLGALCIKCEHKGSLIDKINSISNKPQHLRRSFAKILSDKQQKAKPKAICSTISFHECIIRQKTSYFLSLWPLLPQTKLNCNHDSYSCWFFAFPVKSPKLWNSHKFAISHDKFV